MMYYDLQIPLFEIVLCLAEAVDLISPDLSNHHKRVAYISMSIAREMGSTLEEQNNITLAGLLHDSGGLSLKERLDALRFEVEKPYQHAELGYRLFSKFKPLAPVGELIRYHHLPWEEVESIGELNVSRQILRGSSILHLADRVAVLIDPNRSILGQVKGILNRINEYSGKMFDPELVDGLSRLAVRECFWMDLLSPTMDSLLLENTNYYNIELNLELLTGLAKLFSQIVDFRSRFTATHSSATAACAEVLAGYAGFSETECQMIKVAGFLHDLGKIVIPESILNKNGPLDEEERYIIKSHPYYTYRLLRKIGGLEPIPAWAALHHEKLDGSGYPFHFDAKSLSLGARIICISDIFTALIEDRPYRRSMSTGEALAILLQMAESSELDRNLVLLIKDHDGEIDELRTKIQNESTREYDEFWRAPADSFLKHINTPSEVYLEMGRPTF